MFLENKVSSVHDYIDELDKKGFKHQKFAVIAHKAQFEAILDHLHKKALKNQVKEDPVETLNAFVEQYPSDKAQWACTIAISKSGH